MQLPVATESLVQVHLVDFHPVQPWIGLADKAGTVTVWNWSTDQARVHNLSA